MFESAPPDLSAELPPAERRRAAPSHNRPGLPAGSEARQVISCFSSGARQGVGRKTDERGKINLKAPPYGFRSEAARRCLKAAVMKDGGPNAAESEKRRMKKEE